MDEAQRLAYEERLEYERRQEREREDAYRESLEEEDARRLARYDEAVRLLRECVAWSGVNDCPGLDWLDLQVDREAYAEALAFLAAEPKEEEGGG